MKLTKEDVIDAVCTYRASSWEDAEKAVEEWLRREKSEALKKDQLSRIRS